MSRKVKFPFFYVGKNKPKTDKRQSGFEGEANSNMDKYDKRNGKFVSRRKFDKDGKAYVDLDAADKKHKNDHAHDESSKLNFDYLPLLPSLRVVWWFCINR